MTYGGGQSDQSHVALRKESVDRNDIRITPVDGVIVALRKESVDRNFYYSDKDADWVRSLSARRAWIEIRQVCLICRVDFCRSPQGERG